MHDRILRYLKKAGIPLPAIQILRDALNIHSKDASVSDIVLRNILENDRRFRFSRGLWQANREAEEQDSDFGAALIHIESSDQPLYLRGALFLPPDALWEFEFQEYQAEGDLQRLQQARSRLGNRPLAAWSKEELRLWKLLLRQHCLPEWRGDFIPLCKLAARTLGRTARALNPAYVASRLGLEAPEEHIPKTMTRFLSGCLRLLLDRAPAEHRIDIKALKNWIGAAEKRIDYSRFAFGPDYLQQIPEGPGVYIMKDLMGKVIYVGKSRNLRRRIRSYFTSKALEDPKTFRIHDQLYSLEVIKAANEVEALLKEVRMIRKHRPAINLQIRIHPMSGRRKEKNLVLLVADAHANNAVAYFLRNGVFVGRQSARLGCPPSAKLRDRIRSVYFSRHRNPRSNREPWKIEIISRWLTSNRRCLNWINVDEAGSYESLICCIDDYLHDPEKLGQKVYYR